MALDHFLVPQFIDVEPKIIGPITVRQFIIMLVGMLLIAAEYKLFDFWAFVIFGVLTFGIFGIVAFLKVNGRPFHYFFLNVMETLKRSRRRLWNKQLTAVEVKELLAPAIEETKELVVPVKHFAARSRLDELALVVNTGGAYSSHELDDQSNNYGVKTKK
ncbi:MAG: PrgI family protein [Patescibacteria group bacterium]